MQTLCTIVCANIFTIFLKLFLKTIFRDEKSEYFCTNKPNLLRNRNIAAINTSKNNHKYETDTGNNCRKNWILNIHCIKSSNRESREIQNFRDSRGSHTGNCCGTRLYTKHFSTKPAQRENGNNRARGTGYVESLFCGNLKCHRCRSEETRVHDNSH